MGQAPQLKRTDTESGLALILPGAVSRGAFEAGVIGVMAEKGIRVDRIVATSSGALNGVAYAAGIRSGREKEFAHALAKAWIEHGSFRDSLSLSPKSWLSGRGISKSSGLIKMLRAIVSPCAKSKVKREIDLRIVVAPLNGTQGKIGKTPATTYEKVVCFTGKDFDTAEGLERIFECTTAACAFPGLFAPVDLPDLGPCIDGGAVNNTPVAYALDDGSVDRIIVPIPSPALISAPAWPNGLRLLNHLIEILINERMYRDLKDAELINHRVSALDALVANGTLRPEQLQAVRKALPFRKVDVTEVRPQEQLGGTVFSGFMSRSVRVNYLAEGRKAAEESLPR